MHKLLCSIFAFAHTSAVQGYAMQEKQPLPSLPYDVYIFMSSKARSTWVYESAYNFLMDLAKVLCNKTNSSKNVFMEVPSPHVCHLFALPES